MPIPGTPSGLVATVRARPDGTPPRDRRGRLKVRRVVLSHDPTIGACDPGTVLSGISPSDQRWATSTSKRQWAGIESRFGERATAVAHLLARAGVVTLDCHVNDHAQLDGIRGWALTPPWDAARAAHHDQRTSSTNEWGDRASKAAEEIGHLDTGLAEALTSTRASSPLLPVLVHAAEDLAAGITHDGPRAFSQTHFGDTKERDDAADVLTAAGAAPASLVALGLRRSPYLGLGGPVIVSTPAGEADLSGVAGPVHFRVTADRPIRARLATACTPLLVVENKQAAEAACDLYPDVAVLYCAGQPSDAALAVVAGVAATAQSVFLIPDADLGGVRIAQRLLSAVPDHPDVSIVDVGEQPHTTGRAFGDVSLTGLSELATGEGPVAEFARACLARGYRVEQEAVIRAAIKNLLAAEVGAH